jgi:hypothetical protein
MHCINTYFTKMSITRHQRKTTGCLPVTNKNEPIDTCTFIGQLFFSVDELGRIVCLHTSYNIHDNLLFQAQLTLHEICSLVDIKRQKPYRSLFKTEATCQQHKHVMLNYFNGSVTLNTTARDHTRTHKR